MYFESYRHQSAIHILTISCFIAAFLLFGVSNMESMVYPLVYQLTGILLLVVGTYFLTRYVLKKYRYEIIQSDIVDTWGEPVFDLVITETTGKRVVVVAKVALRDIAMLDVIDKRKDKNLAKEKVRQICEIPQTEGGRYIVYRYANTPFMSLACYLQIPSENSVLVIPYHEKMVSALRLYIDNHTN